MRSDSGTKKENRATIATIAGESLAGHAITPEQTEGPVRMWYCGRKGTGMYSYRVIAAPGMLLVYGDVGDYMLQANDRDLIPWLRGAIKSENYVIGKMVHKGEVFLPDEAVALLDTLIADAKEDDEGELRHEDEEDNNIYYYSEQAISFKNAVLDEWDPEYDSGDGFAQAFHNAGGETSLLSRAVDYEPGVYWTMECLKKFVELLDDLEDPSGPSICSSVLGLVGE